MNQQEVSFRSDEQAQSQDRERLQADIAEAWEKLTVNGWEGNCDDDDLSLLRWALGIR